MLDAFVNYIGKANGVATLDENGRIPYSQLPESAMEFKGTWDASNNTPTLVDGTGDTGDFYVVSVAGTQDLGSGEIKFLDDTGDFYVVSVAGTQNLGSGEIKFLENDRVIYSEGVWSKLSAGDVRTINTIQPTDGNITLTGDNINISASDTTKVSTKVTSHINATSEVHGATSEATASKLIIRDSAGRAQVASPSADSDIATKKYVDDLVSGEAGAVQQALDEHIAKTTEVHGAVSTATANKIAIRDASGRLQVADPSANLDAANKQTVISLINEIPVQIWTAISDSNFNTVGTNAIAFGNDKFVVAGIPGKGVYSTDGITWKEISDMKIGVNATIKIAYGNNKFVVAGITGKGAYSTDGITWKEISDMKLDGNAIYAIAFGNDKFVAAGPYGKGAYSTDGITWKKTNNMNLDVNVLAIAYGNNKFVAVGNSGKGAYSTDGITWEKISDMKLGNANLNAIAFGNDKFVVAGNSGKGVYSTDGITWKEISDMKLDGNVLAIAYGNYKFVAVGNSGKGAYSTDGITWEKISDMKLGNDSLNAIAFGNDKFVVTSTASKGSKSLNLVS